MKKWISIGLILCLTMLLAACGQGSENDDQSSNSNKENKQSSGTFTIGVIPAQTEGAMSDAMDKLQSILNDKLDREVKVEVYPDYNGVVEAMNYDKIDMAYFGPLTYVIAHEKSGAKAIITQLIDGEPFYHSYIITNSDNQWDSLDELLKNPGKKIGRAHV